MKRRKKIERRKLVEVEGFSDEDSYVTVQVPIKLSFSSAMDKLDNKGFYLICSPRNEVWFVKGYDSKPVTVIYSRFQNESGGNFVFSGVESTVNAAIKELGLDKKVVG